MNAQNAFTTLQQQQDPMNQIRHHNAPLYLSQAFSPQANSGAGNQAFFSPLVSPKVHQQTGAGGIPVLAQNHLH